MTTLSRLLVFGAFLALTSCGDDNRRGAEIKVRQVGSANLRREAAMLYKELFVAPTGQFFLPKAEQWPATFRLFKPLRVRAYTDGFSLALLDARGDEEGLYVVPMGMNGLPREGLHARFHQIDDGIYWYWFSQ